MSVSHHRPKEIEEVFEISGLNPAKCYQCGKCSAGCPVREFEVDAPNKIVRYFQLGMYERAFTSPTIWLCAGCLTCSERCPQGFELARFMDAVRELAFRRGIKPPDKKAEDFHNSFLKQIRNHGRAYELGLVLDYKLKTFDLFQDVDVAPIMLLKGKLGILPHNVKNKEKLARIFKNVEKEENK